MSSTNYVTREEFNKAIFDLKQIIDSDSRLLERNIGRLEGLKETVDQFCLLSTKDRAEIRTILGEIKASQAVLQTKFNDELTKTVHDEAVKQHADNIVQVKLTRKQQLFLALPSLIIAGISLMIAFCNYLGM